MISQNLSFLPQQINFPIKQDLNFMITENDNSILRDNDYIQELVLDKMLFNNIEMKQDQPNRKIVQIIQLNKKENAQRKRKSRK